MDLEAKLSQLELNDIFVEPTLDEYAIALVDTSASTKLKFATGKSSLSEGFEDSVFGKQCDILKSLGHKYYFLLFWSSEQTSGRFISGFRTIPGAVKTESVDLLFKTEFYLIQDIYLTNTALAFHNIPADWLKKTKTVYLITDGEMGGGMLDPNVVKSSLASALRNFSGTLSILTVERKAYDFNNIQEAQGIAGSDVFNTIQEQKLTGFVNNFTSYYPQHGMMASFTHIKKNKAPNGYIPYGDKYFLEINMDKFISYIAKHLKDSSESEQLLVAQKLSVTLGALLKNKSSTLIECNLRTFSNLFTIDRQAIYYILGDSLIAEQQGQANIFANYKKTLTNIYRDAQLKLYDNVSTAIGMGGEFCSYPVFDQKDYHILTGPSKMVVNMFVTKQNKYPKSCISKTPVFCLDFDNQSEVSEQCLRQWTRTVYSDRFSVKPGDDLIIYFVLIEAYCISNSNIDSAITMAYLNLAKVMLKKKRSQYEGTELDYLMQGHAPSSVNGTFKDFLNDIEHAQQSMRVTGSTIHLWHEILQLLDKVIPGLYDAQKIHCTNHSLFESDAKGIKFYNYNADHIAQANAYDYSCYITIEDLSNKGGYIFKTHTSQLDTKCSPIFMLSNYGMKELQDRNKLACPVCYKNLTIDDFDTAPPYIKTEIPAIYGGRSENMKVTQNTGSDAKECYLVIMRGTVGCGKSTLAAYIQTKYLAQGYSVYVEGTDKYCNTGMSVSKAIRVIQRNLTLQSNNKSRTIVVIDTCGDNKNPKPFGVDFSGYKKIEIWPNLDENNKIGYLSWSLTNVLNRKQVLANSLYYLSPYSKPQLDEGIQLCKDVHRKKAVSLGLYDHSFTKLTESERAALAEEYVKTLRPMDSWLKELP